MARLIRGRANLFAYGSLQLPEVVEAVLDRRLAGAPATLAGWVRRRIAGRSYPGIAPDPHASTSGVLYRDIDAATFALLDRFEGEAYARRTVEVVAAGDTRLRAEVYAPAASGPLRLGDDPWDLATFTARDLDAFLALCREFRAAHGGGGWRMP